MAKGDGIIPYQMKPGTTLNPNGRPKKIFTILKASGFTKDDIRAAFEETGWQTIEGLNNILDNDNSPAIMKVIARAFLRGAEKGDFRYVSEIIQHVIGKPKETVEQTITQFKITLNLDGSNTGNTIRQAPAVQLPDSDT